MPLARRLAISMLPVAAGCVAPCPTMSLSELDLETEIESSPGSTAVTEQDVPDDAWDLSLVLDTGWLDDDAYCPVVDAGITATIDGEPMTVAFRNGTVFVPEFAPAGECLPIGFVHFPHAQPARRGTGAVTDTILITEGTKTWQIEVADLMNHDLSPVGPLLRGATNAFVWPSAPVIGGASARVGPYVPTYHLNDGRHWYSGDGGTIAIEGDRIEIPIGPLDDLAPNAELGVWVGREPTPSRCDPPLRCEVEIYAAFAGTI
jgi:hypothetical protein